ncbi:MAG: hypothetical protein WEC37_04420 [Anaerolineales bacterium]
MAQQTVSFFVYLSFVDGLSVLALASGLVSFFVSPLVSDAPFSLAFMLEALLNLALFLSVT